MQGYCNMCGKCCEAITLWIAPEEIKKDEKHSAGSDQAWAKEHFHPISKEEAFARNPLHKIIADNEPDRYGGVHFYECDAFDKETRRCTAHDTRPRVCSEYPHYSPYRLLPGTHLYYSTTCDYMHDMPPAMKQEWIAINEELRAREKVSACAPNK